MKILVINPNTTVSMTEAIGEACVKAAQPTTEITAISPRRGPRSIEGYVEDYVAAVATLETIAENRGRYDAFVIACFGDPGLHAARELVEEPVIGIAEAAMHMSCLVAHKFSIVSVIHRIKPLLEDMVKTAGMTDRCASIRTHRRPRCGLLWRLTTRCAPNRYSSATARTRCWRTPSWLC